MSCPFIDENEPRCSGSLNMQHLGETFELCADQYTLCPLYLELSSKKLVSATTAPSNDD